MAEEVAPPRTPPTQPIISSHSLIDNDFWDRMKQVEETLVEAREILKELRGGRDMERPHDDGRERESGNKDIL